MRNLFRAVSQFLNPAKKEVRPRRLRMECLEERALMAIVWTNRGTTDAFNTWYGANAATARSIVDHAIADWNRVITNFNYQNVGTPGNAPLANTNEIEIFAEPLGTGDRGVTDSFVLDTQGKPFESRIRLDDNGAGTGWYFDTAIHSDSEFDSVNGAFSATATSGGALNLYDFYRTVAHEIGHAVGIFGHFVDANDLMTDGTNAPVGNRRLISDANITYMVNTFAYSTVSPNTVDQMYATFDGASTTDIKVRGRSGNVNENVTISKTGSNLTVAVNIAGIGTTTENLAYTTFGNLTVNTGDGNDQVYMNLSPDNAIYGSATIDTGPGTDSLLYSTSNGSQYGVKVEANTITRPYRFIGPTPYGALGFSNAEVIALFGSDVDDQFILGPWSSTGVLQYQFQSYGGNDEIDASYSSVGVIAYGGSGNDIIRGGSAGDELRGDDGADQIWGNNGNDILAGGLGADIVRGGSGSDYLFDGIIEWAGGGGLNYWLDTASYDQLFGEADTDNLFGSSGDLIVS
jgi:hypothetical protein